MYDTSNVFAEDFNTEVTGIAAGTLAWRGDVYATIAPDVWKLRDTTGDGKADERESIAHGFGVHIAYAGHDMHGLTLGPDGKIYWSIGDKGVNVTSKEGKNFFAPHEGAVLRCHPDGSGFEIFARGLRNPQEIAFDQYGNLFSVDNDSDRKGERERFLHITEGSDTGWRNYYQYRGSELQSVDGGKHLGAGGRVPARLHHPDKRRITPTAPQASRSTPAPPSTKNTITPSSSQNFPKERSVPLK